MDVVDSAWPAIKQAIRSKIDEHTFATWFRPLEFEDFDGAVLTLAVPDQFYAEWIRAHHDHLIQVCAQNILKTKPELQYVVRPGLASGGESTPTKEYAPAILREPVRVPQHQGLNPNFTFDRFVVGPGSRFAHAAAVAVAEAPAKAYNPLFIYGSVGLGKTHLMQAVAHKMLEEKPNAKIIYLPSERFTNLLINAIQTRSMDSFRGRFREVDMLLVDDIHFIAGKESTMEEFFHTFNTLYDAHKQIIVSSDRLPKEIPDLEDRLISRFVWGLVADIQAPDLETRVAILKSKLQRSDATLPEDVILFIATNIKSNIRELEGAMVRVMAYASLTRAPINMETARRVLKDAVREESGRIGIDTIQKIIAEHFHIKVADLRARRRTKSVVFPRQLAMYFVRELTGHSLLEIGQYFGGRDHSTVLHACSKIEGLRNKDNEFGELVSFLGRKIKSG